MTREEAKYAAEVMKAYAEGKEIEYKDVYNGDKLWRSPIGNDPVFDWYHNDYRIKPESTYRPFKDKEECWAEMQKHQPLGWVYEILSTAYININGLDSIGICGNEDVYEYNKAFEEFIFADGTPFGVKE